jgi:ribonucleoside-diphosphate reductase alpha chain
MHKFEDVISSSTDYFDGDDLAASVFTTKYALCDRKGNYQEKNPDDMHRRLAREFFRIESKYPNPLSEDEIYNLFRNFRYVVPQGSPMAGIGNNNQIQSISNCFVIESPRDSYGGILKSDQELVQIAKRRGGVGFDISTLRPKGLPTGNAARTTDGIEVFMERFSNSTREVAQGGRRGALMITISVHHPQIRDYINIKRDRKKVTGANISIRLSDEFLTAVKKGEDLHLRFPVEKGADHVVEDWVSATEIWDEIIDAAHDSAEPGLIFWDSVIRNSPADVYDAEGYGTTSTNPCSELPLAPYDSCRLMLVNLISFVDDPFAESAAFDFEKFGECAVKAQRLMDDMIDLEVEQIDKILRKIKRDPEASSVKKIEKDLWETIRKKALNGRRTGLGVTAVGDTLAALGIRYGSEKSISVVEEIYKTLAISAYKSSCIMASERGAFPIHDHTKEAGHPFLERIWNSCNLTKKMSKQSGRRNISILTTAPAGSVSTLTQTSSGIEPAFMLKYTRRRKISQVTEGVEADFIDDLGDSWKEYDVYHHGFKNWMNKTGLSEIEDSPYHMSTASEIDWKSRVKLQAAAQRWIDHGISSTINLPSDVTVDEVKKIYEAGWEMGCKGLTVYRDGCRTGVLIGEDREEDQPFKTHEAPFRPSELECSIHHATIKGEAWTILVGLMGGRPYEVMGGLQKYIEIPKKYRKGIIIKHPYKTKNSRYDLRIGGNGDEILIKDIVDVFDNPNHAGFTRTISLALRHGAPINYVVEQLQKDREMDMSCGWSKCS